MTFAQAFFQLQIAGFLLFALLLVCVAAFLLSARLLSPVLLESTDRMHTCHDAINAQRWLKKRKKKQADNAGRTTYVESRVA